MKLLRIVKKNQGMTLIEVLVALFVFTVGIMYIVRIFPMGFSILNRTQNASAMDRLAQSELEKLKNNPANLPAGIFAGTISDKGFQFLDHDPDDPADFNSFYVEDGMPLSEVNQFRCAIDEATLIPESTLLPKPLNPSAPNAYSGSVYSPSFGPILYRQAFVDSQNPLTLFNSAIIVHGGTMTNLGTSISTNVASLNANNYGIDDTNHKIQFGLVNCGRQFVVTYKYVDSSSVSQLVWEAPVVVPSPQLSDKNQHYISVDIPGDGVGKSISDVTISHGFTQVARNSNGSVTWEHSAWDSLGNTYLDNNDPYQFIVLASPAELALIGQTPSKQNWVDGALAFCPYGHGYKETVASGTQPLIAYISYVIRDWHIIHEDYEVPTNSSPNDTGESVKLSLGNLYRGGSGVSGPSVVYDSYYDNASTTYKYKYMPYNGLFGNVGGNATPDVIVEDLTTGTTYSSDPNYYGNGTVFTVDYKNGALKFASLNGHSIRVYYKALGDWGLQAYKAYDSFSRVVFDLTSGPPTPQFNEYYVCQNTSGTDPIDPTDDSVTKWDLYFRKSYSGRSVSIDYTYQVTVDGTQKPQQIIRGEICNISTSAPYDLRAIDLSGIICAKYPGHTTIDVTNLAVQRIRNITLGMKVIRRDTGSGSHIAPPWKSTDLRTYLGPSPH